MAGILNEELAKELELMLWSIPFDLVSQSTRLKVDIDRVPIHTVDKAYYTINFIYETVCVSEFYNCIRHTSIKNMNKIDKKLKELGCFVKPLRYRGDVENIIDVENYKRSKRINKLSYWLTPEQVKALYILLKIQKF
ncbi:MAG: hypothetical protein LIR46_06835 [Bacteroidota bacterium]|nr:hypothetical protein [Bacteroidota bacterium]